MRTMILAGAMICISFSLLAQSERVLVNDGNDLYAEEKFDAAEIQYRKALKENEESLPGRFNLGNALHKQGKFDQSVTEFEAAAVGAMDGETRGKAMYNRGNSFLDAKQYDGAIASYREALKLNPGDQDAKYNLSYALLKRQQEEQQKKQDGGENQKQDQQNKEQDQKDQQKKQEDQKKNNDQNQPQDRSEDQKPQPDQSQSPQQQMSRADAERILEVLRNNEKEVQKQLRAKAQQRSKSERDW